MQNPRTFTYLSVLVLLCVTLLLGGCKKDTSQQLLDTDTADPKPITQVLPSEAQEIELPQEDEQYLPKGAEVLYVSDESLRLITNDSFKNVKEFYQDLLQKLEAEGQEFSPSPTQENVEVWGFDGMIGEETFYVNLQSNGDQVSISIIR